MLNGLIDPLWALEVGELISIGIPIVVQVQNFSLTTNLKRYLYQLSIPK